MGFRLGVVARVKSQLGEKIVCPVTGRVDFRGPLEPESGQLGPIAINDGVDDTPANAGRVRSRLPGGRGGDQISGNRRF